jgi:hypothetical protein
LNRKAQWNRFSGYAIAIFVLAVISIILISIFLYTKDYSKNSQCKAAIERSIKLTKIAGHDSSKVLEKSLAKQGSLDIVCPTQNYEVYTEEKNKEKIISVVKKEIIEAWNLWGKEPEYLFPQKEGVYCKVDSFFSLKKTDLNSQDLEEIRNGVSGIPISFIKDEESNVKDYSVIFVLNKEDAKDKSRQHLYDISIIFGRDVVRTRSSFLVFAQHVPETIGKIGCDFEPTQS